MSRAFFLAALCAGAWGCSEPSSDPVQAWCDRRQECAQAAGASFDMGYCLSETRDGRDAALSAGCSAEYDAQNDCRIDATCGQSGTECATEINAYLTCYQK